MYIYLIEISLAWGVVNHREPQNTAQVKKNKEKKQNNLNWQEWFRLKVD